MLLKRGGAYIITHMQRKIRKFKRKLKAAGVSKRRQQRLRWRIKNWTHFLNALTPKVLQHCDVCAEHVDRAIDSSIPKFLEWTRAVPKKCSKFSTLTHLVFLGRSNFPV